MNNDSHSEPEEQYPLERSCSLVLPGALDFSVTDIELLVAQVGRLSELETFFSRARQEDFSAAGFEPTLFALFNGDLSADEDLPVAATAYLGETGDKSSAWCLRADPVQLIPDRDQLVLMGPESLQLSQAESNQLTTELNAQFTLDGWKLEACTPSRWYLQQPTASRLRTYPLSHVQGHSIAEYLPQGAEGKQWQRLMNEVQMVLHSSEVNRQRQAEGRPSVSSLWFWGGGKTPDINHSRWSKLWSEEPLSLGLATLSSTPRVNVAQDASTWLNTSISPGEHLLVMDELLHPPQQVGVDAWIERLHNVEKNWISPLLAALRRKEINQLTIYPCNGSKFSITPSGLGRWWRRKKSLATMALETD